MSWSVSAIGKQPAVKAEIARQFEVGGKCSEPEESVRQAAKATVLAAIDATNPSYPLKISASGSQSGDYSKKIFSNSLTISIEPVWNWLE